MCQAECSHCYSAVRSQQGPSHCLLKHSLEAQTQTQYHCLCCSWRLQTCSLSPGVPYGKQGAGPEQQPAKKVRYKPSSRCLGMVSCPITHLFHVPGAHSRAAASHLWGREEKQPAPKFKMKNFPRGIVKQDAEATGSSEFCPGSCGKKRCCSQDEA